MAETLGSLIRKPSPKDAHEARIQQEAANVADVTVPPRSVDTQEFLDASDRELPAHRDTELFEE